MPPLQSLSAPWLRCAPVVLLLVACGGGGGDGTSTSNPTPNTPISASTAPSEMAANFRAPAAMPADMIATAAATLPSSAEPSYLKVWVDDPVSGEASVLALVRWSPPQALPAIQPVAGALVVKFEVYNDAASVTGEWSVQ